MVQPVPGIQDLVSTFSFVCSKTKSIGDPPSTSSNLCSGTWICNYSQFHAQNTLVGVSSVRPWTNIFSPEKFEEWNLLCLDCRFWLVGMKAGYFMANVFLFIRETLLSMPMCIYIGNHELTLYMIFTWLDFHYALTYYYDDFH